ncbi:hypothetical protein [Atrimonas thermophila]|uniref:hypothetical protein n=1 Tax=Atrimonas thermophila TaxID=3064161 RepID=UPI00399D4601
MTIQGHDKYVEWQKQEEVKAFWINEIFYPQYHDEYVGASKNGKFYRILAFHPATYEIEEIPEKEARTTIRGLALRCVEDEFNVFLKEGVEV